MNVTLSAPPDTVAQDDAALLASQCEKEKADLARFIHDGLAQQLTVASLELSLWQYEIDAGNAVAVDVARAKIANLSALVSSMVATARSISGGLRPRSLDSFGLAAAVEGMVAKLDTRLGGGCRYEQVTEHIPASPRHGIHLYRILESTFAGIKQAPAEGIVVRLAQDGDSLHLRIIASPPPQLPSEAAARLRIFAGECTTTNDSLLIRLPCA